MDHANRISHRTRSLFSPHSDNRQMPRESRLWRLVETQAQLIARRQGAQLRRGLAVDIPASLPSVTGLGGTEFRETNNSSWAEANDPSYGSALSYIPEIAWNDTAAAGVLSAGGGGRSIYFSKPAWQAAPGVPNDNTRDVPDISLSASGGHDGYLMCSLGRCVNGFRSSSGALTVVGGTSAGAPAFAGIVAIINQVSRSSQGNINPKLYSLTTSASAVFHDITSGGNQVPCRTGTADCPSGGSIGYSAGAGMTSLRESAPWTPQTWLRRGFLGPYRHQLVILSQRR